MASAVAQLSKRTMRIYALPLTPVVRLPRAGLRPQEHLTYYHFVTPPAKEDQGSNFTKWSNWATNKATSIWAGFGEAAEGKWQRKVYVYGERLVDRIDFEELALKSVDPNLGPKLSKFGRSETQISDQGTGTIPLIYPGSACSSPLSHLKSLLEKRTPRHRKGFLMWMILAPFTAPFMIIPVIPNLPFFFCVWRSWSHYRAYKASAYLEELIARGAISPEKNAELDKVYTDHASSSNTTASSIPSQLSSKPADLDTDASSTPTSSPPSSANSAHEGTTAKEPLLLLTREAVPVL
ncbi:mitochondrial K+-H+ exchange-related-domain-containing protein, partial [Cristinia sonorae]